MPQLTPEQLGEKQTINRKIAAQQQIEIAIRLFFDKEFASAITLALAAEEQMPNGERDYLFRILKERYPSVVDRFNEVRNWLKHFRPPEEMEVYEFEVVLSIMRAVSKFTSVYREISAPMTDFDQYCVEKGYRTKQPLNPDS